MATNGVQPGISQDDGTEEARGRVKEIKKEWSVIEDGALAIRLQEEENVTHYSGNISRRRTVRSDIKVAKSTANEEAIEAFKKEHEIAEKNRQIELEDAETAKKMLEEMMEEEKQKLREHRQKMNEQADREAANELYRQMMEEERAKARSRKSFEETDAELALRLQAHEEKKKRILSQKHRSMDQEMESERLAHQLAKEEKYQHYGHKVEGIDPWHRSRSPESVPRLPPVDYLVPDVAGLRVDMGPEPGAEPVQDLPPGPRKHLPKRMPRQHSAPEPHHYDDVPRDDSDEETNVIAKIQDDEELARRLQREEIQRSRAPSQLTEKERHQLINDQKIAIKMQHEEVMFSKKSTYDNYMGKVRDEIADPEPMVHVNPRNKTAVHADAKYGDGVQLTDYTTREGAPGGRRSASGPPGAADGNILASIDPTYNRKDSGNVVLIKKKSITEEPLVDEGAFGAVQGSKRKDSKDKGKRGSIFSKLKKK